MDQTSTSPETQHQSVTFPARFDARLRPASQQPHRRLPHLRHAERRAQQRHPDLPRADRRPICRRDQPRDRQARLVGRASSGPGKPVDPGRYFVICANVLGGCMGTTGPRSSHDPATGAALRHRFPGDHHRRHGARPEACCIDHLGIEQTVRGDRRLDGRHAGARSGRRTIPSAVFAAVPIAAAAYHSAQNIAFHEVGRQAIMADPDWRGGDYWPKACAGARPRGGAHGRAHHLPVGGGPAAEVRPQAADARRSVSGFDADFQVESYLRHQGAASSTASTPIATSTSPARWTISTSPPPMTACWPTPSPARRTRVLLLSFTSDWLFPTAKIARHRTALNAAAANV